MAMPQDYLDVPRYNPGMVERMRALLQKIGPAASNAYSKVPGVVRTGIRGVLGPEMAAIDTGQAAINTAFTPTEDYAARFGGVAGDSIWEDMKLRGLGAATQLVPDFLLPEGLRSQGPGVFDQVMSTIANRSAGPTTAVPLPANVQPTSVPPVQAGPPGRTVKAVPKSSQLADGFSPGLQLRTGASTDPMDYRAMAAQLLGVNPDELSSRRPDVWQALGALGGGITKARGAGRGGWSSLATGFDAVNADTRAEMEKRRVMTGQLGKLALELKQNAVASEREAQKFPLELRNIESQIKYRQDAGKAALTSAANRGVGGSGRQLVDPRTNKVALANLRKATKAELAKNPGFSKLPPAQQERAVSNEIFAGQYQMQEIAPGKWADSDGFVFEE